MYDLSVPAPNPVRGQHPGRAGWAVRVAVEAQTAEALHGTAVITVAPQMSVVNHCPLTLYIGAHVGQPKRVKCSLLHRRMIYASKVWFRCDVLPP